VVQSPLGGKVRGKMNTISEKKIDFFSENLKVLAEGERKFNE
jgi:hypothetical protein